MPSWKLVKKLEKTGSGLDPRADNPSISLPTKDIQNGSSAPQNAIGIAASKIIPTQRPGLPRTGTLVVTLFEGVSFSPPDQYKEVFNRHQQESLAQDDKFKVPGSSSQDSHHHFLPYALLDFGKSQVFVGSVSGTTENPLWEGHETSYKFDVSQAAGLVIHLYLTNPDVSKGGQDISLGTGGINPLFENEKPLVEWLDVQDGTGKIRVGVEYVENKTSKMEAVEYLGTIGKGSSGSIFRVRKKDTQRLYALKTIRRADIVSRSEATSELHFGINNPFIAPLTFASQSPENLYLLSPFFSGGHLFYHLQSRRRFEVDRSRFYAAELLCAVEYLHNLDIICRALKPGNILLDSLGHVVLCDFSLFNSGINDEDRTKFEGLECPAPEQLSGQAHSKVADWWTLGVLLFEMLTGLPPFYDEDTNEIHRKILSEALQFSESLPQTARDILIKLLNPKPQQRLGVNGASEIKDDAFFDDIDWQKLLQQRYEPTFKPSDFAMPFKQHADHSIAEGLRQQFSGFSYSRPARKTESNKETNTSDKDLTSGEDHVVSVTLSGEDAHVEPSALSDKNNPLPQPERAERVPEKSNAWMLIWDETSEAFYFHNRFTNAKQPINSESTHSAINETPAAHISPATVATTEFDSAVQVSRSDSPHKLPSQSQKQEALEVLLKAEYINVIPQLLQYGMDLSIQLTPSSQTPLEWATEHETLELAKLFLNGADANLTFGVRGPALIKAVEKGNQELVKVLVEKTDRIHSTKALSLAVSRQDTVIVKILLANGVSCDFKDSDRPPPPHPLDGCYFRDISEPEEFIPPLVRAVYVRNTDLVQWLLASGADPNVGYHDLSHPLQYDGPTEIGMACGRVVQLAMELGKQEIVQLLLDSGADVELPQPVWRFHECLPVPRVVYLRVTAGLRRRAARK
ncbi:protein kinase [Rhexocercosporidium sp. MPI-PUGE-AT-0058]|nr:protein kinase [Rhexocercosporidium sp. MPI-PUGE-AT-0058]